MSVTGKLHSYPSMKSRFVALAGLIAIFAYILEEAMHDEWHVPNIIRVATFVLSFALIFGSKKFNIYVTFRKPVTSRERKLVHVLTNARTVGVILTVGSVMWLLLLSPASHVSQLVLPISIYLFSILIQGIVTLLYRPFVTPVT